MSAENLFGVEEKEKAQKPIAFEFKSAKGSTVKIQYTPSGTIKVSDKKAFEGHLKKVADLFEVVEKGKAEPEKKTEPKDLDVTEGVEK